MSIYNDQHKDLKDLLAMASNDEGATLLIPDLQRPYIWKPLPVIVLIDSLIRGWPFGTLLTWKVSADDPARALARAFWKVVDRTDDGEGEVISKKNPPAAFHMVLDGQQRVQSLLLALGGDSWGFKMYDRDWNTDLQGTKQRGRQGQPHWSVGCLCVDLKALSEEYALAKRVIAIDFTKVLQWVVTDAATGQSKLAKPPYTGTLPRTCDTENSGRFVRLSRLWRKAPEQDGVEAEEAEALARELLTAEDVPVEAQTTLARPVGSLLVALGRVKRTRVTYLELSEYSGIHGTRDNYNDAIVNIFTRLNTAGRTLTREDITFAWLKVGWNVAATAGRSAARSFEELAERLEELYLPLSIEDLVSAVSFLWSVGFNGGKLLGNNDLLKGEAIRPMAVHISENWALVTEATTHVSEHLRDRRLRFGEHYQSQSAIAFLWAWYFTALLWRKDRGLGELDKDALEKRLAETLDAFADRWLICSQWAGLWASGSAETISSLATKLSACVKELGGKPDVAAATDYLRNHLETEVSGLEQNAIANGLGLMKATDRKQVRTYYTALWIWNRLDKNRWAKAKLALREKRRRQSTLEVDHVVAWNLWQMKIQQAPASQAVPSGPQAAVPPPPEDLEQAVNELGNCLLLEKNFNISKSNKPLKEFLDKVHEFKEGHLKISDWAQSLDLDMAQVDSAATPLTALRKLFADRTTKIRTELEEFVRGNKSRVDLEDLLVLQSGTPQLAEQAATKSGKFKRDTVKIDFMKRFKEHLWQPPISEKYACWGAKGRSYSCFLSIAEQGEIYFGLEWDHPYLSVPNDGGYDTDALTGPDWHDGDDSHWYDFGRVDLADPQQSAKLIERVLELLGTIKPKVQKH